MKRQLTIWMVCLHVVMAWGGHIMIDGAYTSTEFGIYPGTTRTYQVYVPDQYDGTTPACLYVGLDGVLCNAPAVMDSLIAAGKMPVTIGIFLQPGVIRDAQGEVIRYNRSNEFDNITPTFAEFLESDLLPHALSLVTPDGRMLHVSPIGNDHMIFGLSSGGIAAFTAAWHRPDLFARVFSGVGTFVAMRGGNDLQALVRKHEPKPLRIFLQDGTNDVWNPLFGHWYEGNRMLASALQFAGYDCDFDWSDGGHNVKRSTEIFAQVMEWMWRDWPQPIQAGTTQNDFLAPLLIPDEDWQISYEPYLGQPFLRDSLVSPDSSIVVIDILPTDNILMQGIYHKNQAATSVQDFYYLHNPDVTYDWAFDANGNLWVLTDNGLQICDQNGRVRGILALPRLEGGVSETNILTIEDGKVTLQFDYVRFTRRLNVKAPVPGQRPKSQGQG
jgi:enterochelin esterase-like enzyme